MKEEVRYVCEVCGESYAIKAVALWCEASPELEPCPVQPGDHVHVYERYGPPEPDQVVSVRIGCEISAYSLDGWKGSPADKIGNGLLKSQRGNHQWLVETSRHHQYGKDDAACDTVFTLALIAKDGFWLGGWRKGEPVSDGAGHGTASTSDQGCSSRDAPNPSNGGHSD